MSGPKDAANAALSAARRQNDTLLAHDEACKEVKDLLDHRATGQEPAKLRRRGNDNIYGCEAIRRLAPDHQHRFKNEAYCRELMALTTYTLDSRGPSADSFPPACSGYLASRSYLRHCRSADATRVACADSDPLDPAFVVP